MNIEIIGIELIKDDAQNDIQDAILRVLSASNLKDKSVNIAFVDEEEMLDLQQNFKNKDYVTDVLSFPLPQMERTFEHTKNMLGDIVICVEQTQKQALELGHSFTEEIAVLCAHGLFHLLDFDHERSEEEADKQMKAEMDLLEKAGFEPNLSLIKRQ